MRITTPHDMPNICSPDPAILRGALKYKRRNRNSARPGVNWQSTVTFMVSKRKKKTSMSTFLDTILLEIGAPQYYTCSLYVYHMIQSVHSRYDVAVIKYMYAHGSVYCSTLTVCFQDLLKIEPEQWMTGDRRGQE